MFHAYKYTINPSHTSKIQPRRESQKGECRGVDCRPRQVILSAKVQTDTTCYQAAPEAMAGRTATEARDEENHALDEHCRHCLTVAIWNLLPYIASQQIEQLCRSRENSLNVPET